MQTPSKLISFLQSIQVKPKKGLSQNFLIDPNIVRKTIELADIQSGDAVLEIGPGAGALTTALLEKGALVYAVEKDPVLARALTRSQHPNLHLSQSDFLKFPMKTLPQAIKVVANLPYHITTPILEKLFASSFSSITIMVQKEIAHRMIAQAGSKDFGALSLFVQFYATIRDSFPVPPQCFYPQPTVDSTVIRLDAAPPTIVNPTRFFHLVRQSFQQRRKMLTSSLSFPKERIRNALIELGIRPDARPEIIPFMQWGQLTEKLANLFLE